MLRKPDAPIVEYAKGTFSAERPDFGARTESESEGDALNRSRRFNCEVTVALIFVVIYGCVLDFICIVSLNSFQLNQGGDTNSHPLPQVWLYITLISSIMIMLGMAWYILRLRRTHLAFNTKEKKKTISTAMKRVGWLLGIVFFIGFLCLIVTSFYYGSPYNGTGYSSCSNSNSNSTDGVNLNLPNLVLVNYGYTDSVCNTDPEYLFSFGLLLGLLSTMAAGYMMSPKH